MINLISAIGSIGTFIMALFYFVSVTLQLYQMKIGFIPALGFNQVLLELNEEDELTMKNMSTDITDHEDYLKLYNLGGGAAKKIKIEILLDGEKVIQEKYVNMLPSKESYLLPVNKEVFEEFESTIQNNGYESNINIRISYRHNVSRKQHTLTLNGKLDEFNMYKNKTIYELQFIED
ncbi:MULTISPECIES: hypothetical protein [Staphylococcus]|jgi:archaellum component FlaF (FlaF/FlaG flagellin family)|uniref:Membrane protein n=1 Tax=Staphylococcus nepalensis TaxID=214473 RepID=A0A291JMW9_9STAP|nr:MULTISPECIES: hypothetical protein [Staphylococcus]VDG67735.1 Uncharacterised protein [Lacrimispora indolis]ATH60756.1 hypothetical protein BJD96_10820 [Staphylococcus nepalensis]ATH65803.1 hypothetical protein BJG89_10920 [Staphylococcus nepalensis]AWI45179.1 hypothetical protein BJG88_10715 [Staphylococcus nepalensis]MBO1206661.1 hypothetical protein [Staphylococcus nepalensis]